MNINVFAALLNRVKSCDGNAFQKRRAKVFLLMPLTKIAMIFSIFDHLQAGQSEQPFDICLRACISLYMELHQHD